MRSRVRLFGAPGGGVLQVTLDRHVHQIGAAPEGLVAFGISSAPVRWCGVQCGPDELINFNQPGGFEGTTDGEFSGRTLMISADRLRGVADDLGLPAKIPTSDTASWRHDSRDIEQLRKTLDVACSRQRNDPGDNQLRTLLQYDGPAAVLRIVHRHSAARRRTEPNRRRQLMREALEIIDATRETPLSVTELTQTIGVSAPTLYRAFVDEIGISPKQYLLSVQLSGVRRELRLAPPGTRVADVANEWGYWHMGRFAAYYRAKFGEMPSETLRRSY